MRFKETSEIKSEIAKERKKEFGDLLRHKEYFSPRTIDICKMFMRGEKMFDIADKFEITDMGVRANILTVHNKSKHIDRYGKRSILTHEQQLANKEKYRKEKIKKAIDLLENEGYKVVKA